MKGGKINMKRFYKNLKKTVGISLITGVAISAVTALVVYKTNKQDNLPEDKNEENTIDNNQINDNDKVVDVDFNDKTDEDNKVVEVDFNDKVEEDDKNE